MSKRWVSRCLLSFGTGLSLVVPLQVRADFIIKFTDGGQVIVHRYAEEGQTIKIYTPQGTISFRKDEVERITAVDASQSMSTPLETVSASLSPSEQSSAPVSADEQNTADASKAPKAEGKDTAGGGAAAASEIERIEDQYQNITQQFSELWKKHMQEVNSGIPEEELGENLSRLTELDQERRELLKAARSRLDPSNLPDWAQ